MKKLAVILSGFTWLSGSPGDLGAAEDSRYIRLRPAAYWSFNRCWRDVDQDSRLGTILDSSWCGIDLALQGARCTEGKYGAGARFDGLDDVAETTGEIRNIFEDCSTVLDFTDQLTVSAWVFPERLSSTQTIVNKGSAPDSFGLFLIDESFVFSVAFEAAPDHTVEVSSPASARKWSHVAGVFDGKSVTLYVDGALKDCRGLCAQQTLSGNALRQSGRPVAIGSSPPWNPFEGSIDEVGLYKAALTDSEIRNLAGVAKEVYFGTDSSANPEDGDFFDTDSNEYGYDFYGARLISGLTKARIHHHDKDILTWEAIPEDELKEDGFEYDAALVARPERNYGFSWVMGPKHGDAARYRPNRFRLFGVRQALELTRRWREYEHLVGGRTLFADLERGCCWNEAAQECQACPEKDPAGWHVCTEAVPNHCRQNQEVLEGFLSLIASMGESLKKSGEKPITPGVYTRPNIWNEFFGKSFVPRGASGKPIPFVLWLTGCGALDNRCGSTDGKKGHRPRTIAEVKEDLPAAEEQTLGGMKTVIWQHHVNAPADWDAMRQNPSGNFEPRLGWIILTGKDSEAPSPFCEGDTASFASNARFQYIYPGGCLGYGQWIWRMQQTRTSGGNEWLHVKVKYVSGPSPGLHISTRPISHTDWNGVYGPDYWGNVAASWEIARGGIVDLHTQYPDFGYFPATQQDGYFALAVQAYYDGFPPSGTYVFEIVEISSVDTVTGETTIIYP